MFLQNTAKKNLEPVENKKANFKIYKIDDTAYLHPLNWRACQVAHSFTENYLDYRPLRLTVAMIEALRLGVQRNEFDIEIKAISHY